MVNRINPKLCSKPSKLPHCLLPTCLGTILGGIIDDTGPHKCALWNSATPSGDSKHDLSSILACYVK